MALHPPVEPCLEITLNGVFYAIGHTGSWFWRLGALNPQWLPELQQAGENPPADVLAALAAQQIYVATETGAAPDLTLMCCGLGSAWPGMGRELYAHFPVARRAMDSVAALADWDILALMDEGDGAMISQTRWQIPYLFMLEYGQWSALRHMGLRPSVICGHSLGELIALCLSGVFSLESAWILLETRAEHMAELETKGGRQGGMLAVPAAFDVVMKVLDQYPELRISNRNTARQYVLSGPRSRLLEARKMLRKQRIPAVMLGMGLAFHNPAMRILRDMSLRRLSGLTVQTPQFPMLSCVDASEYPSNSRDIYVRIADLDENMVDWRRLIEVLTTTNPGQQFLELGPQETLCSITTEVSPGSVCMAVDRKGHEGLAMRTACARLFAARCLDEACLATQARDMIREPEPMLPLSPESKCDDLPPPVEALELAQELISETCGLSAAAVAPEMDLRLDLNIRSSALPFILLEAERRMGRAISLERLFQLQTVADLARFIAGISAPKPQASVPARQFSRLRPRLNRHVVANGKIGQSPIDVGNTGCACFHSPACQGDVMLIARQGDPLATRAQAAIAALGGRAIPFMPNNSRELSHMLQRGEWNGIALLLERQETNEILKKNSSAALDVIKKYFEDPRQAGKCWFCLFVPMSGADAPGGEWRQTVQDFLREVAPLLPAACQETRVIIHVGLDIGQNGQDWADMLTLELAHGLDEFVVWTSLPHEPVTPHVCLHSLPGNILEPDTNFNGEDDGSVFLGEAQFSSVAVRDFLPSGSPFNPSPEDIPGQHPWIMPGAILAAMAEGARMALPWLKLLGFTDLRMYCLPALPGGVVRECRVRVSSRVALPLEGVFTRCCRVGIGLAKIRANGRKSGVFGSLCDGVCLLASQAPPIKPLWSRVRDGERGSLDAETFQSWLGLRASYLDVVRTATVSVGEKNSQGFEASLPGHLPDGPYAIVDAALVAGMWTISRVGGALPLESLMKWRFASIGFIRLQEEARYKKLQWRLSWQDESLLRFDVQALGDGDKVLTTIHSLEFDRAVVAADAVEGGL